MKPYLLRLSACLFVLLSFNAKAILEEGSACWEFDACSSASGHLFLNNIDADYSNFSNSNLTIFADSSSFYESNFSFFNGVLNSNYNNFTNANFSNTTISGHAGPNTDFTNANFSSANLSNFTFEWSTLNNVIFRNTDFGTMSLEDGMSFGGSDFCGADLSSIQINFVYGNPFSGSKYCESTIFNVGQVEVWQDDETGLMTFTPESYTFYVDFDPDEFGMIFVSEVPLPPGISLFLSGLVGLGLMRGRNA